MVLRIKPAEADHCPEHSARRRRVAVGIVSTGSGDIHRPFHITFAVKEPEQRHRSVDLHVDLAERDLAEHVVGLISVDGLAPRPLPVLRVGLVPREHITDHRGIPRFLRDRAQRALNDLHAVSDEIRLGVHRTDELSSVQSVPVVHDPSERLAEIDRRLRHSGREDAGEIRLDLIIYVVRRGMKRGMRTRRSGDSVPQVVPRVMVRAPETVPAVGEVNARLTRTDSHAILEHRRHERHLDVEIVLIERLVDQRRIPYRHRRLVDELSLPLELGRTAVGDADGLTDPRALHPVAEFVQ